MKNRAAFWETLIAAPGRLFLFVIVTALIIAFIVTGFVTGVYLYFWGVPLFSIFEIILLRENRADRLRQSEDLK